MEESGECPIDCGECCLLLIYIIPNDEKERLERLGNIIVRPSHRGGKGYWDWYAPCPFWVDGDGHHCSIYADRPEQCKNHTCKEER